ncbi:MAG: hypothetical protein AAGM67_13325 [Bacteroidota bacterium]
MVKNTVRQALFTASQVKSDKFAGFVEHFQLRVYYLLSSASMVKHRPGTSVDLLVVR